MKKPYKFDETDNSITCKCGKPLKKNVLARVTEKVLICFKCWVRREYNKGHIVNERALCAAGIKHVFDNKT